jgi:hypothetical protein
MLPVTPPSGGAALNITAVLLFGNSIFKFCETGVALKKSIFAFAKVFCEGDA